MAQDVITSKHACEVKTSLTRAFEAPCALDNVLKHAEFVAANFKAPSDERFTQWLRIAFESIKEPLN